MKTEMILEWTESKGGTSPSNRVFEVGGPAIAERVPARLGEAASASSAARGDASPPKIQVSQCRFENAAGLASKVSILLAFVLCGFTGCATPPPPKSAELAPMVARFYLETAPGEIAVSAQLPQSGVSLGVAPKPVFSEFDINNAEVAHVELGLCVLVQLTSAAKRDLYRLSVQAQGRRLVLSLNGAMLGVHRIDRAMDDGVIPVFLEIPDEQLPGFVAQLKSTAAEMARVANKTASK